MDEGQKKENRCTPKVSSNSLKLTDTVINHPNAIEKISGSASKLKGLAAKTGSSVTGLAAKTGMDDISFKSNFPEFDF